MVISELLCRLAIESMCRAMDELPQFEDVADVKRYSPGMIGISCYGAVEETALVNRLMIERGASAEDTQGVIDYFVNLSWLGRTQKDDKKYIFYRR